LAEEGLAAAGRVEAVVAVEADDKEAAGMPLLPGSLVAEEFGRQAADRRVAAAGRVEAVVAVGAENKEAVDKPLLPGSRAVEDIGGQAADCRVVAAGLEQIAGNFDTASFVDKERLTRHCLY